MAAIAVPPFFLVGLGLGIAALVRGAAGGWRAVAVISIVLSSLVIGVYALLVWALWDTSFP